MLQVTYITALTAIAFLLHLVWENAQAPLYAGYQSFAQHFPMCLKSTVGDVAITLVVWAFLWLMRKEGVKTVADFAALAIFGFVIAIAIEQHALLASAWQYAPAMPIIPLVNAGLTPILQMTILLPMSFYITNIISKKAI